MESSLTARAETPNRSRRLLFHRVRPVFVFDGATPPLKRRTTIARRRCVAFHRLQLRGATACC